MIFPFFEMNSVDEMKCRVHGRSIAGFLEIVSCPEENDMAKKKTKKTRK